MTPTAPSVTLVVASTTTHAVTLVVVPREEAGHSSGRRIMKQALIEFPEDANLLKNLTELPLEREKLESHTSITLMNDVIHSALKVYSCFLISFIFLKVCNSPTLSLFSDQFNRYVVDKKDSLDLATS